MDQNDISELPSYAAMRAALSSLADNGPQARTLRSLVDVVERLDLDARTQAMAPVSDAYAGALLGEPKRSEGLYTKFRVERVDGRDQPGGDKANAKYFVLDYVNDPYARLALAAYVDACSAEFPALAADLREAVTRHTTPEPAAASDVEPVKAGLAPADARPGDRVTCSAHRVGEPRSGIVSVRTPDDVDWIIVDCDDGADRAYNRDEILTVERPADASDAERPQVADDTAGAVCKCPTETCAHKAEQQTEAEDEYAPPFIQCCAAEDGYEACGLPKGHKGHHVWSGDYLCGRESTIWPGEYCGRPVGHGSVCAVRSPVDGEERLDRWWEAPTPTKPWPSTVDADAAQILAATRPDQPVTPAEAAQTPVGRTLQAFANMARRASEDEDE